jgi:hypothetical protein
MVEKKQYPCPLLFDFQITKFIPPFPTVQSKLNTYVTGFQKFKLCNLGKMILYPNKNEWVILLKWIFIFIKFNLEEFPKTIVPANIIE